MLTASAQRAAKALVALSVLVGAHSAQTLGTRDGLTHSGRGGTGIPASGAANQGFLECTRLHASFVGERPGDQFGWVSAAIPDIDGDGVEELFTSAPFYDSRNTNVGRIYVYSGRTGDELFRVTGARAGEALGTSVSAAGDVNGDGVGDVIAGGPGSSMRQGLARVISGKDGKNIFVIKPGVNGDALGSSVAGVGDVDGDGRDDLAVGAPNDDAASPNAGRVYVVSGLDGSTVLARLDGEASGDNFGSGIGRLGDVTGDGKPELIVGAMNGGAGNRGKVYVYDLQGPTLLYARIPDAGGVNFGQFFVYEVGDVNNDGWPDFYVGDFSHGGGRGRAYVYSGPTGLLLRRLTGSAGDGFSIGRGAGDVDGDGHDDLLLASWTNSTGAVRAGKAEVFSGKTWQVLRTITSTTSNETLGFDANGIGDVDGDGHPDYVLTAAGNANGRGKVYIVAGGSQIESFGQGLAGLDGFVPEIAIGGCPELGAPITIDIGKALGGAPGCLVIGTTKQALPFRGGTLYTGQNVFTIAHIAGGSSGVGGMGSRSFPALIPNDANLIGTTFYVQAGYVDPAAPEGISLTGAAQVSFF